MLYFAYDARIAPNEMAHAAPGAEFQFIAHLSEWGLTFPIGGSSWDGGLPSVAPKSGSIVWGTVFAVPADDVDPLNAVESSEQRTASTVEAIDRSGKRHQVVVHRCEAQVNDAHAPSPRYVELMLAGSRHWSLPVGWIASLEEHLRAS